MKLILTAAVDHLGVAGDIVEVKDGYGRNYLLPRGTLREQIEGLTVQLPARAAAEGRLFGAVTGGDVAAAIKKAGGPSVDKRAVVFGKPIKTVGTHTVGIKLTDAVTAHVGVEVVAG